MAHEYNAANVYTLAELAQFYDPDGKLDISEFINMVTKEDPIIEHMLWMQGNQTDGHKTKIITKIPEPSFRRLYKGVKPSKSGIASVKETTSELVSRWEIDAKELAMYEGKADQGAFRMMEGENHVAGMRQFIANQLFYGAKDVNPDELRGLAARYAYKDGPNVIDAGGTTGNMCSIWGVVWGAKDTFGFYPKKTQAGIQHTVLPEFDATDEDGGKFRAVGDHWSWDIGFTVADWRSVVRVCNIPVASLAITDPEADGYIDLAALMIQAKNKIKPGKRRKIKWYTTGAVLTALEISALKFKNAALGYGQNLDSSDVLHVHKCPIFECESLLETETVLPALS